MITITYRSKEMLVVWKPRGATPLDTIRQLRTEQPALNEFRIGYAGRLDPMAEGLLILLLGEENKNKKKYESLDKTYEFQMLFGVATDTSDLLGLITGTGIPQNLSVIRKNLKTSLSRYTGTFSQSYPPYSAYRVRGKPLYWWARAGRIGEITLPVHEVTVSSLTLTALYYRMITFRDISSVISEIRGDFRQKKILRSWNKFFGNQAEIRLPVACLRCRVSAGTYVRQLVYDLAESTGYPATTYSITRTEIGLPRPPRSGEELAGRKQKIPGKQNNTLVAGYGVAASAEDNKQQ